MGIPLTRSLMLEFDDTDNHIDDQFMFGSEIMMAPILVKGTHSREVYFPQGSWEHYFTGEKYESGDGGMTLKLNCPLGTPCAFRLLGKETDPINFV